MPTLTINDTRKVTYKCKSNFQRQRLGNKIILIIIIRLFFFYFSVKKATSKHM